MFSSVCESQVSLISRDECFFG